MNEAKTGGLREREHAYLIAIRQRRDDDQAAIFEP